MKRIIKKFLCSIVIATLLFASLSGCINTNKASKNNEFNLAFWGITTLNPIMSQARSDFNVFYLIYPQLVRFHGSELECDAAESFAPSNDFTTYTFKIRKGLVWSDGSELNAEDFAYGIYCLLAPEMGSPKASAFYEIKNAEAFATGKITDWNQVGVKVVDSHTLEITLEYAINDYERTIASKHIYPICENYIKKVGVNNYGASKDNLLYAGPYVITDWQLNASISLEKNEAYWDAKNAFPTQRVNLIQVDNENTAIAMFEDKEVDAILDLPSSYYEMFSGSTYDAYSGRFQFIWFNQNGSNSETGKVVSNVNFRQALNYAINRNAICNTINAAHMPASNIMNPFFEGPNGDLYNTEYPVDTVPLDGDIETAKTYLSVALQELGYSDVSELPELVFVTYTDNEQQLECELIIDQWKQNLGLTNIKMHVYDVNTAISTFYSLEYDIFSIAIETDVRTTDILRMIATGGVYNPGIWKVDEFDELANNAVSELDSIKRAEYVQKAQQLFIDQAPMLSLYFKGFRSAVQPYVSGFEMGFVDGFEFNNLVVNKE